MFLMPNYHGQRILVCAFPFYFFLPHCSHVIAHCTLLNISYDSSPRSKLIGMYQYVMIFIHSKVECTNNLLQR